MTRRSWTSRRQVGGRRGCCSCGCGPLLLLLLVVVAIGAALYFKVPQKLGLIKPATQVLLSPDPDWGAALAILESLQEKQVDTQGLELWVLPLKDGSGSMAYAVLDAAEGFEFPAGSDQVVGMLNLLANNEQAVRAGVTRVAIEYRMGEELSLIKMTASTKTLQDYATGRIGREKLMEQVEGEANYLAMGLGGGQ